MTPPPADPRALREQLGLKPCAEVGSHGFVRFINALCETLDSDIPRDQWGQLVTLDGCIDWLRTHHPRRLLVAARQH